MTVSVAQTAVTALMIALLVAGCGRRGAPERPPIDGPSARIDPVDPGSREVPDNDFPLDAILN
ncbi:MAG: lipoprotein [Pseudomonadota bacterium]